MPPISAFVGIRFWSVLVLAIAVAAGVRALPSISSPARLALFLLCQFFIIVFGMNMPVSAVLVLLLLWSAAYLFMARTASSFLKSALVLGVVGLLLGRRLLWRDPSFASLPPGFSDWRGSLVYLGIGFSYMALRFISFAVDLRVGKIKDPSFPVYLSYLFFAPAFIAGPIDRYGRFASNLAAPVPLDVDKLTNALIRIVTGLVKKLAVVALLSRWSLSTLTPDFLSTLSPGRLWLGLYSYAFLLYADFSGYSDLAIGTGRLFGIDLPENFKWPYLQKNLVEFWNSWHISLSNWLRNYIFLPFGQRAFRRPLLKNSPLLIGSMAYLVTMAACGIWHGLAFHYLLWGVYHGIGLSVCKTIKGWIDRSAPAGVKSAWTSSAGRVAATAVTFQFVVMGWLLFLFDASTALSLLNRMTGGFIHG